MVLYAKYIPGFRFMKSSKTLPVKRYLSNILSKMRFKTSTLKEPKHSELVSCVAWVSPDEVLSIADDGKILKWNLVNSETKDFAELNNDFHPTDIHW